MELESCSTVHEPTLEPCGACLHTVRFDMHRLSSTGKTLGSLFFPTCFWHATGLWIKLCAAQVFASASAGIRW
jgi:hypothetical protein